MKAELTLPPELVDEIVSRLFEKIEPVLSNGKQEEVDHLLDVDGLSRYLNVKPGWVSQKIHEKTIPHIKLGKYPRFRKSVIDKWLLEMEKGNGKKRTVKNPANSVRRLLD